LIFQIDKLPKPKNNLLIRTALCLLILIWCTGFSFNSLFTDFQISIVSYPVLKKIYSPFCHQLPAKTLLINNQTLFVCSRCSGIYYGALLISFVSIFIFKSIKIDIKLLYAAILILILDIIFYSINIYSYSKTTAFLTGLFFGSVSFIYILPAFENILSKETIE
jgi:uncharacterized membrane protein